MHPGFRLHGFVLLLILAVATPLRAGVVVDLEHREASTERSTSGRLYLDTGLLKMVPNTMAQNEPELIFQGEQARMMVVDHSRKTYMIIDAAMMQELADRMAGVRAQMEQALSQLPPEQRAQAEEMMKQRMPGGMDGAGEPMEIVVTPVDGMQEKKGKPCQGYDINIDGERKTRIWATAWKNVDIDQGDFASFREMAQFFQKLMESMPAMAQQNSTDMFSGLEKVEGFPVLVESFEAGELESQTIFGKPQRQKLDAATFEPPSGYREQTMQGP